GLPVTGVLVVEELHAAQNESVYAMLSGQTEATTSQIIIASQAGSRNGVLYRLYKNAANQGGDNERIWFDYWSENRAPWITEEWLADREAQLPPWEYNYLHHNKWGATGQRYMSPDLVDQIYSIDYPLLARRMGDGTLHVADDPREAWAELREQLGITAWAVGCGLDRAQPYAHREATNFAMTVKAIVDPRLAEDDDNGLQDAQDTRDERQDGTQPGNGAAGPHAFPIASIDCPNSSDAEIDAALDICSEIVGRRPTLQYEIYQAADIGLKHGADLVHATSQQQVKMFNRMHLWAREGRYHVSPESTKLAAELEEFMVETDKQLPRFEHSSGSTDDRIYAHAHSLEAVAEEPVFEHRMTRKPKGL
ncbi:MAG: hypothetical protein ACOC7J_05755, partial [Armatimonadota bacterium]